MITMVIASLCLLAPVPGEGVSTSEHAPVQPPPSPEFELLIDQLDASSWEAREGNPIVSPVLCHQAHDFLNNS